MDTDWYHGCWVCELKLEPDERIVQAEKVISEPGTEGPLGVVLFHDYHYPPEPQQGVWNVVDEGPLSGIRPA